ncbi:response regulator [Azospirillum picis]|uniref:CheY-like chemotaxis protein/anti-sigma regulatory factor (Ser/Thr protein kinase) n=1 Tax=Azospirillum picis TaxID=488438 RepID=A0ABU0MGM8_9PROT|nr:response regulator [Azospirillum picis]MBP2298382.1 CheY-like chemotaxis protein/anti-sigma regulatory factor (Ser/Thr protein kinase) [Azospirillum picis]MDQ0532569.1 CheY-like chemotaxis protein/anti-sigma regulatory factor (Ser/Thr protein kinase) [Azospirillum picis]
MAEACTALVVDDEEMSRAIAAGYLARIGYRTLEADSKARAWDILAAQGDSITVVLLDRRLTDGDGLELHERMKAVPELADIPVIVQTISDSSADIAAAIRAGVFYYMVKPYGGALLRSVVRAAAEAAERLKSLRGDLRSRNDAITLLQEARFRFRTPQEARDLAIALSSMVEAAPNLIFGLSELLVNAVEHGNLGIGFEAKERLKANGMLGREIEMRLDSIHHRDKYATLHVERCDGRIAFTVTDMGQGFDFDRYMTVDAFQSTATHGRGIALARSVSFDRLSYLGPGNRVVGIVEVERTAAMAD